MTNLYAWKINSLDCYPEQDGKSDVVFTIHWDRLATDDAGHVARICDSQTVTLDPEAPFTPFAELTESQVIAWLESAINPEIQANQIAILDRMITEQANPPVVSPPLPWAPPAPVYD